MGKIFQFPETEYQKTPILSPEVISRAKGEVVKMTNCTVPLIEPDQEKFH